jgi:hypothetical protein
MKEKAKKFFQIKTIKYYLISYETGKYCWSFLFLSICFLALLIINSFEDNAPHNTEYVADDKAVVLTPGVLEAAVYR